MSGPSLEATAKAHGFTRIGINAMMLRSAHRYMCEIWADDFKFVSASGRTAQSAINRAVKAAHAKRKVMAA